MWSLRVVSREALLIAAFGVACGPSSKPVPAVELSGAARRTAELGYCDRLQPELTRAVGASRIGTEMTCLEMPGVTEIGRFGTAAAGEEGGLESCFDTAADYQKVVETSESVFDLNIEQEFSADVATSGQAALSTLLPWMPSLSFDAQRTRRVKARVSLKQARFVTLVGVASGLQGQVQEPRCLQALCRPGYTYVHKALVGIPSITVTALDERGHAIKLGAPLVSTGFSARDAREGSQEIVSTSPVTLAVARSAFRTPNTERLCDLCGRRGQTCCKSGPACDGGLACLNDSCVEVGGPDQPCDGERCASGACVAGRCRTACGGPNQPCCPAGTCSGALRCSPDPESDIEPQLHREDVTIAGGILGTSEDRVFGTSSCGPLRKRGRFALTKVGAGRGECQKAWWFDPANERDCRVGAHFEVSMFGALACRVEIFAAPSTKPDRCAP